MTRLKSKGHISGFLAYQITNRNQKTKIERLMKKSKKEYMSDETFAELIEAAEQALAYERGASEGYSVTRAVVSSPS